MRLSEPAPAKLNLALHVRGKRADGRHSIETVFAFCTDGDRLEAEAGQGIELEFVGPFSAGLPSGKENLVVRAAEALQAEAGIASGARLKLVKNLPIASGIGGGSADAAAALRLLTGLWSIDPAHASAVAPGLGADVPACLLSLAARGEGAGDRLTLIDTGVSGSPVLLVNPMLPLSTAEVFAGWDGVDRGPLGEWKEGRNDLESPAIGLVPEIADMLEWLKARRGVTFTRMSGSGATCFALFGDEQARDEAASACPPDWWNLTTFLR